MVNVSCWGDLALPLAFPAQWLFPQYRCSELAPRWMVSAIASLGLVTLGPVYVGQVLGTAGVVYRCKVRHYSGTGNM